MPSTGPATDDPVAHAEHFATEMRKLGYGLDFSLQSLRTEPDRILASQLFGDYNQVVSAACKQGDPALHPEALKLYQLYMARETGLGAYFGETLRRHLGGEWQGNFSIESPMANFYLSTLSLAGEQYNPSHYIAYRLSNGLEATGSLADYLSELLNRLEDPRSDHH